MKFLLFNGIAIRERVLEGHVPPNFWTGGT